MGQDLDTEFIRCARCHRLRAADNFNWRRKAIGQRDTYCRPCRADYKHEHYVKNRQRYIDNAAARRRRVVAERTRYLLDFFGDHPCVDCGEADRTVLEFDHLGDKLFNVSTGLRDRPWDDVLAEMAKCEIVCANCHRRRTAKHYGFLRALMIGALTLDGPDADEETDKAGDGN